MESKTKPRFRIVCPNEKIKISEQQQLQINEIVTQGFEQKFLKPLRGDKHKTKRAINLMIKCKMFPMDFRFLAIDEQENILGITLVDIPQNQNFKAKIFEIFNMIRFLIGIMFILGPRVSWNMINSFMEIDNINKGDMKNLCCEFYLCSIREDLRNKGIATELMAKVFEYIKENINNDRRKIKVCIYESNKASISHVKKFGFQVTKQIATPIMEKHCGKDFSTLLEFELNFNDLKLNLQ